MLFIIILNYLKAYGKFLKEEAESKVKWVSVIAAVVV